MTYIGGGRRPIVIAVFALLLLSLVFALGIREDNRSRQKVDDSLAKSFHLLREPPSGLPSSVIRQLPSSYGGHWSSARALPLKHQVAWVVPAEAKLCLVIRDPTEAIGIACASHRSVLQRGLFVTLLQGPSTEHRDFRREIVGLVPDSAKVARLFTPAYPTVKPKLVEGVFEYRDGVPASPQDASLSSR